MSEPRFETALAGAIAPAGLSIAIREIADRGMIDVRGEAGDRRFVEAVERVRSGEVTYAVRDSQLGGVDIRAGQILGLADGRILAVGSAVSQVVEELLGHLVKTGNELITLYWGHQETEASAQQLAAQLRQRYPQAEVEVYFGGQPLYYYYLSVE